jgi:hypothetical protein
MFESELFRINCARFAEAIRRVEEQHRDQAFERFLLDRQATSPSSYYETQILWGIRPVSRRGFRRQPCKTVDARVVLTNEHCNFHVSKEPGLMSPSKVHYWSDGMLGFAAAGTGYRGQSAPYSLVSYLKLEECKGATLERVSFAEGLAIIREDQ